jgi:hypothetical protein
MAAEGQIYLAVTFSRGGANITKIVGVNIAATATDYLLTNSDTGLTYIAVTAPCAISEMVLANTPTNHFTVKLVVNGAETGQVFASKSLSPAVPSPHIRPVVVPVGQLQFKVNQPS